MVYSEEYFLRKCLLCLTLSMTKMQWTVAFKHVLHVNIEKNSKYFSVSVRKRKSCHINIITIFKWHIPFSGLTADEASYQSLGENSL